jgi:hypothetical protein
MRAEVFLLLVAGAVLPAPASGAATVHRAAFPPETCPVTLSPVRPFTPPLPYPALPPSPDRFWYGSEALWVMPKTDGTWRGLRTEAGYRDKLFVWRTGFDGRIEQRPKLTVRGKRRDAEVAPFTVTRATNAYHPSFEWAMLAGVDIPTPGCWELRLDYGATGLAFVVWVVE